MGALLALHAAFEIKCLKGAVSINAPIYNNFPLLTALAPIMRYVRPYFPKSDRRRLERLKKQGRFAYEVTPVKAFQSMIKLRNKVVREVEEIKIPLLIIQSLRDESVDSRSGRFLANKALLANLIELPESGHIATMEKEKEEIAVKIAYFMEYKQI